MNMCFRKYYLLFFLTLFSTIFATSQETNNIKKIDDILQQEIDYQLILAADSGKLNHVRELIEWGANPNASMYSGMTPIIYASQSGRYRVVKELISIGANINAQTNRGLTALHYASMQNHDSIAELLILNGAKVHPVSEWGLSPLHYACTYGYPFMAYVLLHYGAHIDSVDIVGNTPLMASVYTGMKATAEYLLENWANVDKADNEGFTPLMVAAQYNDTTIMRILTNYGADINKRNKNSATALATAINSQSVEAILFLLEKGAHLQEFDPKISYAELAYNKGLFDISKFLQSKGTKFSKGFNPQLFIPFYTGLSTISNDILLNFGSKAYFSNYKLYLGLDFAIRPYSKAVIVDEQEFSYQFFERRNIVSLCAGKDISTKFLSTRASITLSAGARGMISWGNYNYPNPSLRPKTYTLISPEISLKYQMNNFYISSTSFFMYNYRETPIMTNFTFGYIIDLKSPKIVLKRIPWY